ncbi:MAG: hypothetical protein IPG32_16095 [Saprospirales bacterium]|nr:hypothetical protein [Saprospirales bacterium]
MVNQIIHAAPPKAVAIHGSWGTGKTSLLKQIYQDLGGDYFGRRKGEESDTPTGVFGLNQFGLRHGNIRMSPISSRLCSKKSGINWLRPTSMEEVKEVAIPGIMSILQSIDVTFTNWG